MRSLEELRVSLSGILGFNVTIGQDRASEGNYSVYYFQNSPKCRSSDYQSKSQLYFSLSSQNIGFRDNKLNTNVTIKIKDEPPCGFDGQGCKYNDMQFVRMIISICLAISIFAFGIGSIQKYRHWKYEQEISGLLWRIDKDELKFSQSDCLSQSKMSIMSGVSQEGIYPIFVPKEFRATYRGTLCCVKYINLDHRRADILTRANMKNMKNMREIKHRNVCPFIGAYVEDRKITLVTEYANRGSLEDILENEDIRLDKLFISSLVQDLLRGMNFLHHSNYIHGNLKSTNCVVTGRWVLQVTDYDLYDLRCLWKSPELLRIADFAPGTKEGDVYAFGIILHEIIGRKGPFSTSDSTGEPDFETIIEDVKRGQDSSGILRRPNTLDLAMMPFGSDPEVLSTMKAAWTEEPKYRPDFKELTARLKKLKKSGNLMDHMVLILEEHNKNLEGLVRERTQEVYEEKKKTEELLYTMLPTPVAANLCRNIPVEPQSYDSVTIYFSDIVGFTKLASDSSPYEIVTFLDDLYREFDTTIRGFDVYKVETIGDAYMVVSGLPNKNEGRHCGEIASMSLELLENTKSFKIKHKPEQILKLRIGLHTGPVIAGVVGHTMPRYCFNGEPLRIHISKQCKDALTNLGGYIIEERGYVEMKGKGAVLTYWLNATTEGAIKRVDKSGPTMTFFQRLTDDGRELRRRSPRLSIDIRTGERRTPSISRPNRNLELSSSFREPPVRDFAAFHRQRLNQNHRANSLESSTRGGFLSPPVGTGTMDDIRTPSSGSVRESHSLDDLPVNPPSLSLPVAKGIRFTPTPSSSEPYLVPEENPRVNFNCARFKNEDGDEAELNPMLDASIRDDSDLEGDVRTDSPSSLKRESVVKNFINSFIPKNKRDIFGSEKSCINGLQRESHV
ncbi:Receptor-type guanylate cyclase Gyc76C [Armadillidium vulgare]|nr:Receptor-type guanylate cyclase Gyc76C [Armadillidium vulgare]